MATQSPENIDIIEVQDPRITGCNVRANLLDMGHGLQDERPQLTAYTWETVIDIVISPDLLWSFSAQHCDRSSHNFF